MTLTSEMTPDRSSPIRWCISFALPESTNSSMSGSAQPCSQAEYPPHGHHAPKPEAYPRSSGTMKAGIPSDLAVKTNCKTFPLESIHISTLHMQQSIRKLSKSCRQPVETQIYIPR
ncbi:hypothetical protein KCU91_g68, partial [Aureobasidium melanogenum]